MKNYKVKAVAYSLGLAVFLTLFCLMLNRHENDFYTKMTDEEYLAQAYTRACRVATTKRCEYVIGVIRKPKDNSASK